MPRPAALLRRTDRVIARAYASSERAANDVPDRVVRETKRQRGEEPVPPEQVSLEDVDAERQAPDNDDQIEVPGEKADLARRFERRGTSARIQKTGFRPRLRRMTFEISHSGNVMRMSR
jgi:hypothetical protein